MAFSTRVRYGLRLLVRLALQSPERRTSMAEIAAAEAVSPKYLEQIVGMLKPLGILTAVRGAGGGYVLAQDPRDITLDSVFACLGELDGLAPCVKKPAACGRVHLCATYAFWTDFDRHMRDYLRSRTLHDLTDGQLLK
jgi:Rrf2 family protein